MMIIVNCMIVKAVDKMMIILSDDFNKMLKKMIMLMMILAMS